MAKTLSGIEPTAVVRLAEWPTNEDPSVPIRFLTPVVPEPQDEAIAIGGENIGSYLAVVDEQDDATYNTIVRGQLSPLPIREVAKKYLCKIVLGGGAAAW